MFLFPTVLIIVLIVWIVLAVIGGVTGGLVVSAAPSTNNDLSDLIMSFLGCGIAIYMAIVIGILICAKCFCLYLWVGINGVIGMVWQISDLVQRADRMITMQIVVNSLFILLNLLTSISVLSMALCKGRSGGGADREEGFEESDESESDASESEESQTETEITVA